MKLPGSPSRAEMYGVTASAVAKQILEVAPDRIRVTVSEAVKSPLSPPPSNIQRHFETVLGFHTDTAIVEVPTHGIISVTEARHGRSIVPGMDYLFDLLAKRRGVPQMRGASYNVTVFDPSTGRLQQGEFNEHEYYDKEFWTDPANPPDVIEPKAMLDILDAALEQLT